MNHFKAFFLFRWFGKSAKTPVITQQLELFASEVVPILRKRGLFRSEYDSASLRGHFGLEELPLSRRVLSAPASPLAVAA